MPDPGPFESPYHHVTLPGQAAHEAPPTRPATLTAASWSWLAATALLVPPYAHPSAGLVRAPAFAGTTTAGTVSMSLPASTAFTRSVPR
ncbi:hypothetical protein [Saccharothrix yanglingensis]|uniref:Uncharacterized protein n=1 Tax=Saccharothrix yanglingensis TaxID=659496 RepID=A0ABU0WU89_9PSEU|nr:hypothetical protein [Saccharothrix yanglingensis]MDQ2582689.1 hypothetical protein [Saccharothrix yanglingensis]